MTDRQPSLAEVFAQAIEHRLSGLHVCMPGTVESYDVATQTAVVRPGLKNVLRATDGEREIDYPLISSVPVCHPRGGKWFLHFPLTAGDAVTLVFGERSLEKWRQLGGVQNPLDLRKHDLSDAIALPINLHVDAESLTSVIASAAHMSIGKDDGATIHINEDGTVSLGSRTPTDAVATSNKVFAELQIIQAALTPLAVVLAATDPTTTMAVTNLILTACKAILLAGFPHSVASATVKCVP